MMPIIRVRRSTLLASIALFAGVLACAPAGFAQTGGGPPPPPLTGVDSPNAPTPAPDAPTHPTAPASAPVGTTPAPAPTTAPAALAVQTSPVHRIVVEGNERIETATILSYLPIAPGRHSRTPPNSTWP